MQENWHFLYLWNFFFLFLTFFFLPFPVFRSWYFSIHIGCVLLAIALPVKPRHLRLKEQHSSVSTSTASSDSQKPKTTWAKTPHPTSAHWVADNPTVKPTMHQESQRMKRINQQTYKLAPVWTHPVGRQTNLGSKLWNQNSLAAGDGLECERQC